MNYLFVPCIKAIIFVTNASAGVIEDTVYNRLINEYVLKEGRMGVSIYNAIFYRVKRKPCFIKLLVSVKKVTAQSIFIKAKG